MTLSYLQFIELLENNFNQLQIDYSKLYSAFRSREVATFQQLRDKWQNAAIVEGTLTNLHALFHQQDDSGKLKLEIKKCLMQNELGLIEYTKIILKRQFDFITREFNDVGLVFGRDNFHYIDLIEQFYEGSKALTDEKFVLAAQVMFVELFTVFEDCFQEAYPLHVRYVFTGPYNQQEIEGDDEFDDPVEQIKLDYPEEIKKEIIKMMYDVLNDEFIESMSEKEFNSYFGRDEIRRKIWWKANDLELAYLFDGFETAIDTIPEIKIRVKNNPKRLICHTFLKRDGKNFYYKNLADNIRLGRKADESNIDDRLYNLLITITRKFNH